MNKKQKQVFGDFLDKAMKSIHDINKLSFGNNNFKIPPGIKKELLRASNALGEIIQLLDPMLPSEFTCKLKPKQKKISRGFSSLWRYVTTVFRKDASVDTSIQKATDQMIMNWAMDTMMIFIFKFSHLVKFSHLAKFL